MHIVERRCGYTVDYGGSTGPRELLGSFSWKNGFSVSLNSVAGATQLRRTWFSARERQRGTSSECSSIEENTREKEEVPNVLVGSRASIPSAGGSAS